MESMQIRIAHLFPDLLNLYGDRGNIICLKKRLEWRGINASVKEYRLNDFLNVDEVDILFLGGGSDREQKIAANRLLDFKEDLRAYVENGGVLAAICGGYQLIGHYYQADGERIKGLSLIDAYTVSGRDRLVGNIVLHSDFAGMQAKIAGFENHRGRTYIGSHKPLGNVTFGYGNNGEDYYEGVVYRNVIGTYLHGPVFPKNPKLADFVIQKALDLKYGGDFKMPLLDDAAENRANAYIVNRFTN